MQLLLCASVGVTTTLLERQIHGHRSRSLLGSFGRVEIEVPRARLNTADGKTTEWKSKALRAYHGARLSLTR